MRRALYALLPLVALFTAAELVGRARPDPRASELARLYEPDVALVTGDSARATARPELHAQTWAMPAPGYRVAFVGDSTVWGQLPDAFEAGLVVPGAAVEVLNFGIRGAASDRARIAAAAAGDQDLDLLVVYVGHNEVTEARLNPASLRPFWARRLRAAARSSGTARLLGAALDPLRDTPAPPPPGALRSTGDAGARPLDNAEWAPIAASYRANLTAICAESPVPVVFVAPVSSLINPGEAPDTATPVLRDAMMAGLSAARNGDATEALVWADRLRRDYPDIGPPHALRGVALRGLGRAEEGLAALREARRRDGQPARATEAHHAIVAEVGAACGATVVAPEAAFLADPRYLSLEDPLFMDRVHPTLAGNVLLAGAIAAGAPLPAGATFDPARVALTPPASEAERGWKVIDELWPNLP